MKEIEITGLYKRIGGMFLVVAALFTMTIATLYLGMGHYLETERKSITGILYAQDPSAAWKYANIILNQEINEEYRNPQNITAGINAMKQLGYTEIAFSNIPDRYPITVPIVAAGIGEIVILLLLFFTYARVSGYYVSYSKAMTEFRYQKKSMKGKIAAMEHQNDRTKDFIENIAHQIRTPISFIYLVMDGMEQSEKTAQCIHALDKVSQLLNSLLKIARLEAGKVMMEMHDYAVNEIVQNICAEYHECDKLKLDISMCGKETEQLVHIDAEWFREALQNMINNALEHSKVDTPVTIRVCSDRVDTRISIQNYGDVIDAVDVAHIFDRFYTAKNVRLSHTGIGLNLSDLIIRYFGGKMLVASDPVSERTTFTLILPHYQLTDKISSV